MARETTITQTSLLGGLFVAEEPMDDHIGQNSRFRIAWKSDQGRMRTSNEDAVVIDTGLGLFAVADGMGGHKAGSVASGIAVRRLSEVVRQELAHESNAATIMHKAILAAHHAILTAARENLDCEEMGTTVVAALSSQRDSLVIGHVGDSRAYMIEQGAIEPLTQDHTFLAEWLRDKLITPEAARVHPARHGLFMALGVDDEIEPELRSVPWPEKACLLLCSDGLTDVLDEQEIVRVIEAGDSLDSACDELIAKADQNGSHDNVTVVLIEKMPVETESPHPFATNDQYPCGGSSPDGAMRAMGPHSVAPRSGTKKGG